MTRAAGPARLLDDPPVAALLALLNPPGEETRIVGGALRNALLGLPVADTDFATTLPPPQTMRRAAEAGWQAVPTGIEHGTVTLVHAGRAFEVTTLRADIETDGRRATVRFGRDFREDAARRDFTINALSMGPDGVLHDYFGGRDDLAAARVRFIGDPDQRIREDYLRALRLLRFSAAYGGGRLDAEGFAAVLRNRAGLARLSRERVRQELLKLLAAPHAGAVLAAAEAEGLIAELIGSATDPARFAHAVALAAGTGVTLGAIARLAALCGGAAGNWPTQLRLSNAEIATLRAFDAALAAPDGAPRLLAYRHGAQAAEALVLRVATGRDGADGLAERLTETAQPAPRFRITGADLLAAGLAPGPEIGRMLAEIEAGWIAAGLPDSLPAQRALLAARLAAG